MLLLVLTGYPTLPLRFAYHIPQPLYRISAYSLLLKDATLQLFSHSLLRGGGLKGVGCGFASIIHGVLNTMATRTAKEAADRRSRKIAVSASEYEEGVKNPRNDWATRVKETEGKRDQGLKEAIADGRITKGAQACGTAKQIQKTVEKGVPNWQTQATSDEANTAYENSMDSVVKCVDWAKAQVAKMPEATRAQRIAKSAAYQTKMGECMDKARGR